MKNKAAQSLGRKSWAARSKGKTAKQISAAMQLLAAGRAKLSPARRAEIAKIASDAAAKARKKLRKRKIPKIVKPTESGTSGTIRKSG